MKVWWLEMKASLREEGRPAGESGERWVCRGTRAVAEARSTLGKWQHHRGAALGVCWFVVVYLVRSVSCGRTFPQECWRQMWGRQLVALIGLGVLVRAVEGELGRLAKM